MEKNEGGRVLLYMVLGFAIAAVLLLASTVTQAAIDGAHALSLGSSRLWYNWMVYSDLHKVGLGLWALGLALGFLGLYALIRRMNRSQSGANKIPSNAILN
jgi:hypothetical protein